MAFLPHNWRLGYRRYQMRRTVKLIHTQAFQGLGVGRPPYIGNTIDGMIGLGVYRGEILVLGQAGSGIKECYHLAIDKLRIEYLPHIQEDIPCQLSQAAALASQYLRSSPLMQDLQKLNQIQLLKPCPYTKEPTNGQCETSKGDGISAFPASKAERRLSKQYNQECRIGQCPSTCPYSTTTNVAKQPKGNDTIFKVFTG